MKKGLILIITLFFIAGLFFLFNSYVPISGSNKCNDKKIFRYQFGIYKIDSVGKSIWLEKVGGANHYFGFSKISCLDSLDKNHWQKEKNTIDSTNQTLNWRLIRADLYINKNKEIAFKELRNLGGEYGINVDYYITKFDFEEGKRLKNVIDTATFQALSGNWFKDKYHIYEYYGMLGGGLFSVYQDADYATFKTLGDYYAKDKNHIYVERGGIMEKADYKTFTSKIGIGPYAKDKNGYYSWGDIIEPEYYDEHEVKEAMQKLNK